MTYCSQPLSSPLTQQQALAKYKEIHAAHPTNVECLRYLVTMCTDLGRRDDAQRYMTELRKAERAAEATTMAAAAAAAQRPPEGGMGMGLSGPGGAPGMGMGGPDGGMGGGPGGYQMPDGSISPGLNVPLAGRKKVVAKEDGPGHDDWGNEELGEDLLPM